MKERPILFSGPMVRAILDGRKTQTRRVVKHDARGADEVLWLDNAQIWPGKKDELYTGWVAKVYKLGNLHLPLTCPYGKPGDRLWVKHSAWYDKQIIRAIGCLRSFSTFDGYVSFADGRPPMRDIYSQMSENWTPELLDQVNKLNGSLKRRSGRFLHRWASRITLEITGVRVERLQDISHVDAYAEGVRADFPLQKPDWIDAQTFKELWEKINGKKHPWASNPWVWVVEFQKI